MSGLKRLAARLSTFFRPSRAERDLSRELASHRQLLEDELRRRGMTPQDAERAAARKFYGVEVSKEQQRDARSFGWLEDARRDLRYAARVLGRQPAFTLIAILTLALAIGANSAIFTVVRSVLLRPLPYPEPERLVLMYDSFPGAGIERAGTSVPNYFDRLTAVTALESQALYQWTGVAIGEVGSIEGGTGMRVTPSLFHVLRAEPHRGRVFSEQDGEQGHHHVVILSYGYWQQAFAGRDSAIGRDLRINGERYTVVGVMPDRFTFLDRNVRVWLPAAFKPEARAESERFSQNYDGIGRLAAGATVAQAQQQVDTLIHGDVDRAGELKTLLVNAHYSAVVTLLAPDLVRTVRGTLQVLWGGVLFVLLIAGANVTNLVLVRASSRMKELATRHALGASRGRIARQLMTENLLLTIAGGLLGLGFGQWGLGWLSSLSSIDLTKLPRGYEIGMDWVVVAFTFGLAIAQGLLIGVLPIAQLSGLQATLRDDARTGTAGRSGRVIRRGLVTVQVALAFVLLIGAGLMFASFQRLLAVDPGFKAEHVLTGVAGLPNARYKDDTQRVAAVQRALERVRALPGIAAAGVTSSMPFAYGSSAGAIFAEGYVMQPGESIISPNILRVTPGYFEALGVPLKRGRFFADGDVAGAPRAVIIDERVARHFWPNTDPIGHRMYQPENASEVTVGPNTKWLTVVGVVAAMKQQTLIEDKGAQLGAFYLPFAQSADGSAGFVIKTNGDPVPMTNMIQQALATIDPELKMGDVKVMPERIEQSLHDRRTPMLLSLGFGTIALLLASIGIYGVLAYQVSQRTREIGIRMALGSNAAGVLRLILREGALLVCVGLVIGLIGAVALREVIASQLYGVGVLDPVVLASVSAVLVMAALLACVVPARRASRVDPVVALTQQQ